MTTTLAYLPPIQQIPAKHLRTDTCRYLRYAELSMCDADSPTRPHTYGVCPWSCPAIATEPCRPTACVRERPCSPNGESGLGETPSYRASAPAGAGDVGSHATVHCSLLTVHWSFTFSAKERDSETGLSYFGSRYYSSDLSVWLSVDPMSGKYPSLSPYVYCANNPVRCVDPDGEAWWIPRGKTEPVFDPDISMENCPSDGIFIGQTCAWQQSNLSQLTVTNCYGDVDGSVSYQPLEVVIKPHRCYNRALSENIYSKMKKQNTGMDLLSSCGPLLSLTMEAIKNKYPESKGLKIGSYAFGGGLAGVNIFYTWNSNKKLPEKIFDTSTDIIGIFGIYGTLISTELQTFKRAGKFFMQCKYELDMYFKEINNPNYWWN